MSERPADADGLDPAEQLREAVALQRDGDELVGHVHEDWDVYGVPHGGYLLALAGAAALAATDRPDVVTTTTHFLRKTVPSEIRFTATVVGGSRRFTSVHLVATQEGRPVLTSLTSLGDRGETTGPSAVPSAWEAESLLPPSDDPTMREVTPIVAQRFRQQLDAPSAPFLRGERTPGVPVRSVVATEHPDQLTALLACDITPPAVWNALGSKGWVPTLELTAHLRADPAPGPLRIEATTTHVTDGLLEEDALVHDATGRLVAQSRQLALWTE